MIDSARYWTWLAAVTACCLLFACARDKAPGADSDASADVSRDVADDASADGSEDALVDVPRDLPADVPTDVGDDADVQEDVDADAPDVVDADVLDVGDAGDDTDGGVVDIFQGRATEGLVAYYPFLDDTPGRLRDRAETFAGLDFVLSGSGIVRLPNRNGVAFVANAVPSTQTSDAVVNALRATNAFTVEVWFKPASLLQEGPARILGIERTPTERMFALGMEQDTLVARVRHTGNVDGDGIDFEGFFVDLQPVHVVVTFGDGLLTAYRNGSWFGEVAYDGDLSVWSAIDYVMTLGNLNNGWRLTLGEYYLAAIYNRVLLPAEVSDHYDIGFDLTGQDRVTRVNVEPVDLAVSEGLSARFRVSRVGSTAGAITVPYVVDGSAVGDATVVATEVVLEDAVFETVVDIPIPSDGVAEGDEALKLTTWSTGEYDVGTPSAVVVVEDADEPPWVDGFEARNEWVWFRANSTTGVPGEFVDVWRDQGPEGVLASARHQPRPFVTGDGVWGLRMGDSGYRTTSSRVSGWDKGFHIFVVTTFVESEGTQPLVIIGGGSNDSVAGNFSLTFDGTDNLQYDQGSTQRADVEVAITGEPVLVELSHADDGAIVLSVGTTVDNSAGPDPSGGERSNIAIGRYPENVTNFNLYNGELFEVIIVTDRVDAGDLDLIRQWLRTSYGLP